MANAVRLEPEETEFFFDEEGDLFKLYVNLKSRADFQTGKVGLQRRISRQWTKELLQVPSVPGRHKAEEQDLSISAIRYRFQKLLNMGLLQKTNQPMVYKLPWVLISQERSIQKRSSRGATAGTTEEQPEKRLHNQKDSTLQGTKEQPQDTERSDRPLINTTTTPIRARVDQLPDDERLLAIDEFDFVISEESIQRLLASGLDKANEPSICELFRSSISLKQPTERYTIRQWQQRFVQWGLRYMNLERMKPYAANKESDQHQSIDINTDTDF